MTRKNAGRAALRVPPRLATWLCKASASTRLIKRLVGLPGDHVVVRNNLVFIKGKAAFLKPAGLYQGGYGFTGAGLVTERFGGGAHVLMFAPNRYATDYDEVVPAGEYFFHGRQSQ